MKLVLLKFCGMNLNNTAQIKERWEIPTYFVRCGKKFNGRAITRLSGTFWQQHFRGFQYLVQN